LTYPTRDPTEVAIRKNYWSQAIAEYKLKDYPKKNNLKYGNCHGSQRLFSMDGRSIQ
jgi:hypothetical protein